MSLNSVNDRLGDADADAAYDGLMLGTVSTNEDPKGIARIKVKVPNVYDTDQGDVPWVLPSKKSPFGQGPGYGVYGSPWLGSPVRVSFQNGDPHYPVYECDEYLAAHANPKFASPKTWGYKDPVGNELYVNMETGAWEFTHQSGLTVKYDGDGNMMVHVPKDSTTDIGGNETETVTGNSQKTVNGTLNLTVQGNAVVSAQSNLQIDVGGNLEITAGGNITMAASGSVDISGSTVNLN